MGIFNTFYQVLHRYQGFLIQGTVVVGSVLTLGYLFKNRNLSPAQKILPISGVVLAGTAAIPAAIGVLVNASASYVPVLMAIAYTAGLANDAALCLQERTELYNLLQETKSKASLKREIKNSTLKKVEKKLILDNVFKLEVIYDLLYQLRDIVINDRILTEENKTNLVHQINKLIEDIHQDKSVTEIGLNINDFDPQDHDLIQQLDTCNQRYQQAKNALYNQEIILSADLKCSLKAYTKMQNQVYAQFLPKEAKIMMINLIEGNALEQKELEKLYFNMSEHFKKYYSQQALYALPHISVTDKGNDLFSVADKLIQNDPILSQVRKARKQLIQEFENRLLCEQKIKAIPTSATILKNEFNECHEVTIHIIDKVNRMLFLKKSLPRHRLNFLLDLGFVFTTLGLTFGLVTTPFATDLLYAGGMVFTVLSVTNGITLAIKQSKHNKALTVAKKKLIKDFLPKTKRRQKNHINHTCTPCSSNQLEVPKWTANFDKKTYIQNQCKTNTALNASKYKRLGRLKSI